MSLKTLQGKLLASLLLGLAVIVVIGLVSDLRAVIRDLRAFNWGLLPLIFALTLLNYLLRGLKWDYFLRRLRCGNGVSVFDSGLIFTAGMVMAVTPGKLGEVFKSYLLKRVNGTAVSRSAPIVLAERLTDGLAMLLLMGLGLTLFPPARPVFVILVLATLAGILIAQHRPLATALIDFSERLPLGARVAPRLRVIYESTRELLDWRVLLISTVISVLSWGFECVAFAFVLVGLGVEATALLLLQATFIFAASTLFGLVSFLPGGLGVSEVSSVGMLVAIVGMSAAAATTATLLIRFATLWFGVLLGAIALAWFGRRYGTDESDEVTPSRGAAAAQLSGTKTTPATAAPQRYEDRDKEHECMASIFSRIVSGAIPAAKVYEDDQTLAFLDINPASRGHTLVICKEELPGLLDLPPELLASVAQTTQRVARALHAALQPDGFNVIQNNGAAAGQTVFHYHVHIIPRWSGDGALAAWRPGQISAEEISELVALVRAQLAQ
jgi:glycosyltransferase 2 family protein